MELKDISNLLDAKLDEKLDPIITRLERLEEKVDNVLAFVAVGNEDITKQLKALKKVAH